MNKITLMLAGIVFLLAISSSVQATNVTIGSIALGQDESGTVPIMINDVTDAKGANFILTYNSSVVHVLDFTNSSFPTQLYKDINNVTGVSQYSAYITLTGLNGDIKFADVTLKAIASSGSSPLNLTIVSLKNSTAKEIPRDVYNGTFTISEIPSANIVYSNLDVTPTSGAAPLAITASAKVENTGGVSGDYNATLKVDGVIVNYTTGTLGAGANITVSFEHTLTTAGTYNVAVDDLEPISVVVSEPANIVYSNLDVTPTSGAAPLPITASAKVENTGGVSGDYNATLKVDGVIVNYTTGTLGAGADTTVSLEYTLTTAGTYNVTVDDLEPVSVSVLAAEPDLIVTGITVNCGYLFGNESNEICAVIKNAGTGSAGTSHASFVLDGYSETVNVSALAAGSSETVCITDPTIRNAGDVVAITVTSDSNSEVGESNETNNASTLDMTVVNNGYKGKRYTGGEDITTLAAYDLNGNLVYSAGDSYYQSGSSLPGWTTYDVAWNAGDLPVTGTVREARLYVPYTWDKNEVMSSYVSLNFNGAAQTWDEHYQDEKMFSTSYPYGMLAYNVTLDFNTTGNVATLTNSYTDGGNVSIRGMILVVIYEDASEPRRQIFINEEFDMLYGGSGQCTIPEEATAWAPITGTSIDTTGVVSATLITAAPGADPTEGDLLFNEQVWNDVWNFAGDTQIGIDERDVKSYLKSTDNLVGFQSSGDYMEASNAFLVVEYGEVPPATFNLSGYKLNETGAGLQDWKIMLLDVSTGSEIRNTTTNANGYYEFMNLANGSSYNVSEEMKAGWTNTSAAYQIKTIDGADITNVNFTNKLNPVLIILAEPNFVQVGVSTNVNVTVTAEGSPIENVNVTLSGAGVSQSVLTGSDGKAFFSDVNASIEGTITITAHKAGFTDGAGSIQAVSTEAVVMSIGNANINIGQDISLPIVITNANEIAGGSVKVLFNPAIVNVLSAMSGDFGGITVNIDNTSGSVFISNAGTTAVGINEAVLATINFTGVGSGTTALTLTQSELNKEDGSLISPATVNGSITVELLPLSISVTPAEVTAGVPAHVIANVTSDGSPVPGATVNLNGAGVSLTNTTDGDGEAHFYDVTATSEGTIIVTASKTNYSTATTTITVSSLPVSETFSISGYKLDQTGAGIQNWKIMLLNVSTGSEIRNTITNAQGYYAFTTLTNGSYNVSEEMKAGWTNISPAFQIKTIAGADIINVNFTNEQEIPPPPPTFSISGYKIKDDNGNGTWDAGESGVSGWKITLLNDSHVEIANVTTNSQGLYNFNGNTYAIMNGTYYVVEEENVGWRNTSATEKEITIDGSDVTNLNFTNQKDEILPVIDLASRLPANNSLINTSTPTISVSYYDEFSGINTSAVTMKLNGTLVNATATAAGVSYTAVLADGLYTVQVNVTDMAGNVNSTTWTFTKDAAVPTFAISININSTAKIANFNVNASEILNTFDINITRNSIPISVNYSTTDNRNWTGNFSISGGSGNFTTIITGTDLAGNSGVLKLNTSVSVISTTANNSTTVPNTPANIILNITTGTDVSDAYIAVTGSGNVTKGVPPGGKNISAGIFISIDADEALKNNFTSGTLTVFYNVTELNPAINESTLKIYVLNETTMTWEALNSTVNTEGLEHSITAQLPHLSIFSLSGEDNDEPDLTDPTASPSSVHADWRTQTTLSVNVTDNSTIASVTVNLSEIGNSSAMKMEYVSGNMYSVTITVPDYVPNGTYELPVNATDEWGNSNTSVNITLEVTNPIKITDVIIDNPNIKQGQNFSAKVNITTENHPRPGVFTVIISGNGPDGTGFVAQGSISNMSANDSGTVWVPQIIPMKQTIGSYDIRAYVYEEKDFCDKEFGWIEARQELGNITIAS